MVSRPLGNFTYSAWMSARSWAVTGGTGRYAAPPTTAAPAIMPPNTAQYRPLPPIAHPPDPIAQVITHQQRAVRRHDHTNRPPPLVLSHEPSGDEILSGRGPAALQVNPHDFVARLLRPVPGAVIAHECITLVVGREHRPRVEREPEGRRVRLHRQRRRLDARAVGPGILGVGLIREIALRPPVPLAVLENIQMLGRDVVAQVVAVVVVRPKLARGGVEGEGGGFSPAGTAQARTTDASQSSRVIVVCSFASLPRTPTDVRCYRPFLAYTPCSALSPGGIVSRLRNACSAARSTSAVTAASISSSCFTVIPSVFEYSSYIPIGSRLPQCSNSAAATVSRASRSSWVACPPIRNVSATSSAGPPPRRHRSAASCVAAYASSTLLPSNAAPGMP